MTERDMKASEERKLSCMYVTPAGCYNSDFTLLKRTVIPVHAIEANGGTRGIAPLIINLEARRRLVVSITPWPLYTSASPSPQSL